MCVPKIMKFVEILIEKTTCGDNWSFAIIDRLPVKVMLLTLSGEFAQM